MSQLKYIPPCKHHDCGLASSDIITIGHPTRRQRIQFPMCKKRAIQFGFMIDDQIVRANTYGQIEIQLMRREIDILAQGKPLQLTINL